MFRFLKSFIEIPKIRLTFRALYYFIVWIMRAVRDAIIRVHIKKSVPVRRGACPMMPLCATYCAIMITGGAAKRTTGALYSCIMW